MNNVDSHQSSNPSDHLQQQQQQQVRLSNSQIRPKSKRYVSRPLQRNQACTTCRSRKVRCDAQKPACGACRRSAAAHGEDPSLVICHYDSEDNTPNRSSRQRCSTVQQRQQQQQQQQQQQSNNDLIDLSSSEPSTEVAILQLKISQLERSISEFQLTEQLDNRHHHQLIINTPSSDHSLHPNSSPPLPSASYQLSHQNWPSSLPPRSFTIQLVLIFFNQPLCAFGQVQFIQPSSFIQRLYLPSYHPYFPNLALIHSILLKTFQSNTSSPSTTHQICHTRFKPLISQVFNTYQVGTYWIVEPDDGLLQVEDYHLRHFKRLINQSFSSESGIFEIVQAINIYCYYAFEAGDLVEAWVYSGLSVRFCAPLGLNCLETLPDSLQGSKPKPKLILAPPTSTTEKFERASTFWFCFQIDRFFSVCSGKSHSISEEDVASLLPIKPGSILSSSLEPIPDLNTHPLSITNPLILSCPFQLSSPVTGAMLGLEEELRCLELIGTLILGRVSDWLRRSVDPVGFNLKKVWKVPEEGTIPDLRKTIGFIELDEEIQIFKMSMRPKLLEDIYEPISNNARDQDLDLINQSKGNDSINDSNQQNRKNLRRNRSVRRQLSNSKMMIKLIINLSEILLNECFMSTEKDYDYDEDEDVQTRQMGDEGVKGVNDHGLGIDDRLRNGYGGVFDRDHVTENINHFDINRGKIFNGSSSSISNNIDNANSNFSSSNQNGGSNILTNMKIKSACDGIFEVFEQIYNNSHDDDSYGNYHDLEEGQCRSDLRIDLLRDLNPFSYFCWMVGVRNLVRFLVKDEIELIEINQKQQQKSQHQQQNHFNQQQREGQLPNNSFNNGLEDETLRFTNDDHHNRERHTKLKIKENFLKRSIDEKLKQIEQMIRFISVDEFDQQQIGNSDDHRKPLNGSSKVDGSSSRKDYSSVNGLGECRDYERCDWNDERVGSDCRRGRKNLIKEFYRDLMVKEIYGTERDLTSFDDDDSRVRSERVQMMNKRIKRFYVPQRLC